MTADELEKVVRAIEAKRRRNEMVVASLGYAVALIVGGVLGAIVAANWLARCVG